MPTEPSGSSKRYAPTSSAGAPSQLAMISAFEGVSVAACRIAMTADPKGLTASVRGNAARMARAIWTGSISFGLVTIPVKVFSAIREHDVHFHQVTARGARVHY